MLKYRETEGIQCDKTKIGENVKTLGTCCKKWQHIDRDTDSPEEIERKEFLNRILADKKPYFFKYKYKALNKELREHIDKYKENAQRIYAKPLEEILSTPEEERTEEENIFARNYYHYLPVVDSDCVMNKICKHIENIDFHIKQKVRSGSDFDYKVLLSQNFTVNNKFYKEIKETVESTFKTWEEKTKSNRLNKVQKSLSANGAKAKFDREAECGVLKDKLENIISNEEMLANHLVYLFYVDKPSYSKSTLWILVGKQLYENIKAKHTSFNFPIKDPNGAINFLYEKYQTINIPLTQEDATHYDTNFVEEEEIQ